MPLVTLREVLLPAFRAGYAVGAFNANNLEFVQAIVWAARDESAPVVVQASAGAIEHAGLEQIVAMVTVAARQEPVPVVLHLDHGRDLDLVRRCIEAGFTSVMFDGSRLPWEENRRATAQVVEWAHRAGITAEGELGQIPVRGTPDARRLQEFMTDPEAAGEFVAATGVDALAVAVGSVHQMRSQEAVLDIERVRLIRQRTGVPLVLHGSSGVTDESLRTAVQAGISKVNVATALNMAFRQGVEASLREQDNPDPRVFLREARERVRATVRAKIRLLGCAGKA